MNLEQFVRDRGGIVRASSLRRAGWSNRALTQAVADAVLVRPRRGWLAVPDVDKSLLSAASAGVALTCITQAKRLGLWVLAEDKPHVAAHPHSGGVRILHDEPRTDGKSRPRAIVHWAKPVVPRPPDALVDPIENVLILVSTCQPFESALAVWESALRHDLVDALALARLPLPAKAREILAMASSYSDSGLESFVVPRLRWLGLRILRQTWIAGHRVDFLIGERLVLQVDGGTHVGAQRSEDIAHDAALLLLGYHVIRVGYTHVIDDWPQVQDLIMRAVAQGLHRAG